MTVLLSLPIDMAPEEVTVENLQIDPALGELVDLATTDALVRARKRPVEDRVVIDVILNRFGLLHYCA